MGPRAGRDILMAERSLAGPAKKQKSRLHFSLLIISLDESLKVNNVNDPFIKSDLPRLRMNKG